MRRFFTCWLPLLVWAAAIYALSSIPSLESGFPLTWDVVIRKIAHAAEFGILGVLLLRVFSRYTKRHIVLAGILGIFYAATDEYHQSFVPGREGTPWDVLIDGLGVVVSLLLVWRFGRHPAR
jgi:VanZ family protein